MATVAPGTALTRFKHLRAFCSLLAAEGEPPASPMAGLRLAGWRSDAMLARYGASRADARVRETHRRLARGDRLQRALAMR